jgi:hypothetical protein
LEPESGPRELLEVAINSRRLERPLVAPLLAAAAGEVEGLSPQAVLGHPTKLSNLLRDLTVGLRADVAVAEFGSLWDAEALGVPIDWSGGMPVAGKAAAPRPPADPDFANSRRGAVVLEAIRRLRTLLNERALVAASVTGATMMAKLLGTASTIECGRYLLAAVRLLCEAGAQMIWVVEEPDPPADPSGLAAALAPVWGTIRFYQALGSLHLAGAADGWLDFVANDGQYVPCFNPELTPSLVSFFTDNQRAYGLSLPPEEAGPGAKRLLRTGRCLFLTHDRDLAGRVPVQELGKAVACLHEASVNASS